MTSTAVSYSDRRERAQDRAAGAGIEVLSATRTRVVGEMACADAHLDDGGAVHAGMLPLFADCLAERGNWLNLSAGARCSTIELKTTLFAPVRSPLLIGECNLMHSGTQTRVWETVIRSPEGEKAGITMQTSLVSHRPATETAASPQENVEPDDPVVSSLDRPRRGGRSKEARDRIFSAACKVIAERGFGQATVREIAHAAGMPVASLYRYVSSKDELLVLIFETYYRDINSQITTSAAVDESASARLRAAIEATMRGFDSYRTELKLMYLETNSLTPEARRRVVGRMRESSRSWQDYIEEGIERGEFEVQNPELAANLIGFIFAVWPLRHWGVGKFGWRNVADGIADLVLNGVRAR